MPVSLFLKRKILTGISCVSLLSSCASFHRITQPETASIDDGASYLIFRTSTANDISLQYKKSENCYVEPECTRRSQSHYIMRDSNNILTEYFFDIENQLHVVRIGPNSTGDYFLQYVGPALAHEWIQSSRIYFSIPEPKSLYYLGQININKNEGQQIINAELKDMNAFYQNYPQFKGIKVVNTVYWRRNKDLAAPLNLSICNGGATVGMVYGTVGITGYRSSCRHLLPKN